MGIIKADRRVIVGYVLFSAVRLVSAVDAHHTRRSVLHYWFGSAQFSSTLLKDGRLSSEHMSDLYLIRLQQPLQSYSGTASQLQVVEAD